MSMDLPFFPFSIILSLTITYGCVHFFRGVCIFYGGVCKIHRGCAFSARGVCKNKKGGASMLHLNFSAALKLKSYPSITEYCSPVHYCYPQPFVPFIKDEGLFL